MSKKDKKLLLSVLEPLLVNRQFDISMIDQEQKSKIISLWKEKFMPDVQNNDDTLWHTFSFDHYPHSFGENAIMQFNKTHLKEFIIFSTYYYHAIECTSSVSSFPDYGNLCQHLKQLHHNIDLYIIHKNFKWTFVIPHEKDLGPYYAI